MFNTICPDAFESSHIVYFYLTNNIFFSNSLYYMFINIFFLLFLILFSVFSLNFFSMQVYIVKECMSILHGVVLDYVNYKNNIFYVFISYVYIYIFVNNLLGLIPFSNTINNHLNITGMMSFICWLGILCIGLSIFGTRLISMFCVSGIPVFLIPFLAFIEVLSYFFRFVSLSLRLFANILSGHILLETIYIFIFKLTLNNNNNTFLAFFIILVPSFFLIILIIFETIIAVLQSYIFVVLCLIYLKDSLVLH